MKIYTYTIIANSFEEFEEKVPYVVAVIEDEHGNHIPAFIDNYEEGMEVRIGQKVLDCGKDEKGVQICRF